MDDIDGMKITAIIQGVTTKGEVLWRIALGNEPISDMELHVWRMSGHQMFEMSDEQLNPTKRA
jgi:hypothetical protein